MTEKQDKEEFALFLDDSGSPKPTPEDEVPFFAMGGVLVRRVDEAVIESLIGEFKEHWKIDREVPLHGSEIRSRKKRFAWLGKQTPQKQEQFMEDLTSLILRCPVVVHACVISRSGYLDRYLNDYGLNTWEMMKSAFSILVDRAAKYADSNNGTVMVYYEKAGKTEDKLIEQYYHALRLTGHPFNPTTAAKYSPMTPGQMSELLRGIEGKSKNRPELQLADLCLYPIAKVKFQPENKAFWAMKEGKLIVDCHLQPDQVKDLGIKYYCFDKHLDTTKPLS